MKKSNELKIGEVAKYLGVSTDTLRLYEERGLFRIRRDPQNGYRYFNREDILFLSYLSHLRQFGMSLDETRRITQEFDVKEAEEALGKQEKLLRKQVGELEARIRMIQDYRNEFSGILRSGNKIEIIQSPAFICMNIEGKMTDVFQRFRALDPVHIPRFTYIASCKEWNSPLWKRIEESRVRGRLFRYALTLLDEENLADVPDFPHKEFYVRRPQLCVHCLMRLETGIDYSAHHRIQRYMRQHHLTPVADPMIRTLFLQYYQFAYYDFWAPVES